MTNIDPDIEELLKAHKHEQGRLMLLSEQERFRFQNVTYGTVQGNLAMRLCDRPIITSMNPETGDVHYVGPTGYWNRSLFLLGYDLKKTDKGECFVPGNDTETKIARDLVRELLEEETNDRT